MPSNIHRHRLLREADQHHEALVTERHVAAYLGLSVRTVQRYRIAGTGPRWHRIGRAVRYRLSEVAEWATGRSVASTAEADSRFGRGGPEPIR